MFDQSSRIFDQYLTRLELLVAQRFSMYSQVRETDSQAWVGSQVSEGIIIIIIIYYYY